MIAHVNLPPPPTSLDTCRELLALAKRDHVPLRRSFVQRSGSGGGPGPLAAFVANRRSVALQLYLLFHANASGGDFGSRRHAAVWARALGLSGSKHSASVVSRNWRWLEVQGLIERERTGRLLKVTLLDEGGSGTPYVHPGRAGNYFKLPHEFWLDEWNRRLDMPGIVALLILLSRRPGDELPQERAPRWYGISADTLGRGLRTLEKESLLQVAVTTKQAPLSPLGYTWERHYWLRDPFARRSVASVADLLEPFAKPPAVTANQDSAA